MSNIIKFLLPIVFSIILVLPSYGVTDGKAPRDTNNEESLALTLSDLPEETLKLWLLSQENKFIAEYDTVPYDTSESKFKYWDKLAHWFQAYNYSNEMFLQQEQIDFKKSTFVNIYLEPVIDHKHWMFWITNKITKARNGNKVDPFVIIEPVFKPADDQFSSYTLKINIKGSSVLSSKLSGIAQQINTTTLASVSGANPEAMREKLALAVDETLDLLSASLGTTYAPPIVIGYNPQTEDGSGQMEILLNGDQIRIFDGMNEELTLVSLDKDLNELDDRRVTWQNANKTGSTASVSMAGVTRKEVSLSYRGYTSIITVRKSGDLFDIKDFLKEQILAVLQPRKQKYQDTLKIEQDKLTALDVNLVQQLGLFEAGNLKLSSNSSSTTTLRPVFTEPRTLSDESTFSSSDKRVKGFELLREKKDLTQKVRKKLNVVAFVDLVVEKPEALETLADGIIRSGGQLLAQILFDRSTAGQEQRVRNMIIDYLNSNIERIAGSSTVAITEVPISLPVIEISNPPAIDVDNSKIYMNPFVPISAEERTSFLQEMNTYLEGLEEDVFVNVSYSQDISGQSYQDRASGGRPDGLDTGYKYINIDYVNIPGSVKYALYEESDLDGEGVDNPEGDGTVAIGTIIRSKTGSGSYLSFDFLDDDNYQDITDNDNSLNFVALLTPSGAQVKIQNFTPVTIKKFLYRFTSSDKTYIAIRYGSKPYGYVEEEPFKLLKEENKAKLTNVEKYLFDNRLFISPKIGDKVYAKRTYTSGCKKEYIWPIVKVKTGIIGPRPVSYIPDDLDPVTDNCGTTFSTKLAQDFHDRKHPDDVSDEVVYEIATLMETLDEKILSEYNTAAINSLPTIYRSMYYEGWDYQTQEDYERYRDGLKSFIDLFKNKKIDITKLTDSEKMLALAASLTATQKATLTAVQKAQIINVISKGTLADYWNIFSFSDWNGEFIAISVLRSVTEGQYKEFLDILAVDGSVERLFYRIDDFGIGKENFKIMTSTLYAIWSLSEYGNSENVDAYFTYDDATSPLIFAYSSEKTLGFYFDGFDFEFDGANIKVTGEDELLVATYHQYQMVNILDVKGDGEIKLPDKYVPAFYLKAYDDKNRYKNYETGVVLALDVVTTVSGVGNLAKLRHLSKLSKLGKLKVIIGAVEVATSTASIILNYTDACNDGSDFCNNLKKYVFWMEMATLSGDVLTSQMLKRSARKALDAMPPAGIQDDMVDLMTKHADEAVGLALSVRRTKFLESFDALPNIKEEAWTHFEGKNWEALYDLFKKEKVNDFGGTIWPPNFGFSKIDEIVPSSNIKSTDKFDRFQTESSLGGGFASPVKPVVRKMDGVDNVSNLHYTHDSRMLSENIKEGTYYFEFNFKNSPKGFDATFGEVMPWFNKVKDTQVAGEQVMFSKKLHNMDAGDFSTIQAQVRHNGEWRKCVMNGQEVMADLQAKINKLPQGQADELVDYINNPQNKNLFKNNPDLQDELIDSWLQLKKSELDIPNCK